MEHFSDTWEKEESSEKKEDKKESDSPTDM
jgi:hypothetical protein